MADAQRGPARRKARCRDDHCDIPIDQTLDRALKRDLPAIAMGSPKKAMILALRNMIEAATGWENVVVAEAITRVLGEVHGESRGWILSKVTSKLFRMGDMAPFSMPQQVPLMLNGLVEVGGDSFTADDIIGLVWRGEKLFGDGLGRPFAAVRRLF